MKALTVVVNGQPTEVTPGSGGESLASVMSRAMARTGNLQYGPLEKWEARSRAGDLLDQSLAMDWITEDTIFLNLKPGVAA